MLKNKKAFTIIELIVVISILAILGTIGFISFSSYLISVRDSNRTSQLKGIYEGLETIKIKKRLPLPDDYVEVRVDGKVIGYQGYAGEDILDTITYSKEGLDPKTKKYFSYYLTKNRKYFQLMAPMEVEPSLVTYLGINNTFAYDYSDMYSGVVGDKLGILTDEFNTPIQEVSEIRNAGYIDLVTTDADRIFISTLENGRKYTFSGSLLANKLETLSDPGKYGPPKYCPDGFVGSWGDAGFNQKGFCVAKYEMGYVDETGTNAGDPNYDFYTLEYDVSKKIISTKGRYPIGNISFSEAISACKSLGDGYHLITNAEWMSLARDIEFLQENWSTGEVGNGYIYNGLSGDDSDPRRCFETGPDMYYQYRSGEGISTCNVKRQFKLFGGETIWDFAGGIWEYVDKGVVENTSFGSGDAYWTDSQFTEDDIKKYGPLINRDPNTGVGGVFNLGGDTSNAIERGGSAWDGDMGGVYSLDPGTDGSNKLWNLGFRCAKTK